MSDSTIIRVRLDGQRPLIFDRYAGDNNTQLPLYEKVYRNQEGQLTIPAINLYSMLVAENTKSVCRQYMGKKGRSIALAIAGFTNITPDEILILGEGDHPIPYLGEMTPGLKPCYHVARLKGGIPNPKERPQLSLPWALVFQVEYMRNQDCPIAVLETCFRMGGNLGLGTFRPFFGRYQLTEFSYD